MTWLRFHYDSINTFAMLLILGIFAIYLCVLKKKTKSTLFLIGYLAGNIAYILYLLLGYWIDLYITASIKSFFLILSSVNLVFLALFACYYHKNFWPVQTRIVFYFTLAYFFLLLFAYLSVFYKLPVEYSYTRIPGFNVIITKEYPFAFFIYNMIFPLGFFIYIWIIIVLFRKAVHLEILEMVKISGKKNKEKSHVNHKTPKIQLFKSITTLFTLKTRQAKACRSFSLCIAGQMLWFLLFGVYIGNLHIDIHIIFKIMLNYFPVITCVFFIIIYMNNSADVSSFTIKFISFSVILPVIVMSLICSTFLIEHKKQYFQTKILQNELIIQGTKEDSIQSYPPPVEYVVREPVPGNEVDILYDRQALIVKNLFTQSKDILPEDVFIIKNEYPSVSNYNNPGIKNISYNYKNIISGSDARLHRIINFITETQSTRYDIGYKYEDYLAYMHSGTWHSIAVIFFLTLILLFIISLFIRSIIRKPLANLLKGVDEVKKGNLTVFLNPIHNDEIGIITESFNSMIGSLKISGDKIKEYTLNLENMVEERAKKIEEKAFQLKTMNIALQNEIFERKRIENRLEYNALHDPLTGLANRTLLFDHLKFVMDQQERREQPILFCLMFIDLDRFKIINDSLGHEFGDQLLVEFGTRLRHQLRKQDTIARIGGDEFIVLIPEAPDVSSIRHCAERILELAKNPFIYNKKELIVTVSIGITLSSQNYIKPEEMIRDADIAMYKAKSWGRNRYAFFDIKMHEKVAKEQKLEAALHNACENGEFSVVYQPIIDQQTGKADAFEALIRWNHPEMGIIPPCNFIQLAEETGLILSIGKYVLKRAVCACKKWHSMGFEQIGISINCSARQFQHKGFHKEVQAIIEEYDFKPEDVILEITESMFVDYVSEEVHENLMSLKNLGVRFALDDFGSGFSSLAMLHNLPISILKIDRSISLNIPEEEGMCNIMRAIISLARHINMKVVAEGIETRKQIEFLSSFGEVYIQGYYFSKPLSEADTAAFIKKM